MTLEQDSAEQELEQESRNTSEEFLQETQDTRDILCEHDDVFLSPRISTVCHGILKGIKSLAREAEWSVFPHHSSVPHIRKNHWYKVCEETQRGSLLFFQIVSIRHR